MTKELAVVQGPPGTGKTFTSVTAIEVILANRQHGDPPVIVAAQTNHAVDMLLCHTMRRGANILRLGGRTEDEDIVPRTIFNLRQKFRGPADSKGGSSEKARRANVEAVKVWLCEPLE
jgi:helicase required for RNAi-mediated heterochromatin assembly 1